MPDDRGKTASHTNTQDNNIEADKKKVSDEVRAVLTETTKLQIAKGGKDKNLNDLNVSLNDYRNRIENSYSTPDKTDKRGSDVPWLMEQFRKTVIEKAPAEVVKNLQKTNPYYQTNNNKHSVGGGEQISHNKVLNLIYNRVITDPFGIKPALNWYKKVLATELSDVANAGAVVLKTDAMIADKIKEFQTNVATKIAIYVKPNEKDRIIKYANKSQKQQGTWQEFVKPLERRLEKVGKDLDEYTKGDDPASRSARIVGHVAPVVIPGIGVGGTAARIVVVGGVALAVNGCSSADDKEARKNIETYRNIDITQDPNYKVLKLNILYDKNANLSDKDRSKFETLLQEAQDEYRVARVDLKDDRKEGFFVAKDRYEPDIFHMSPDSINIFVTDGSIDPAHPYVSYRGSDDVLVTLINIKYNGDKERLAHELDHHIQGDTTDNFSIPRKPMSLAENLGKNFAKDEINDNNRVNMLKFPPDDGGIFNKNIDKLNDYMQNAKQLNRENIKYDKFYDQQNRQQNRHHR